MGFPIPSPHTYSMPSSHFPGRPAPGHTGWLAAPPHHQRGLWATHRIEEDSEEELAPVDDLVQLAGATRVLVVEDGVREEAAGLPWEDLGMGKRGAVVSPGMDGGARTFPQNSQGVSWERQPPV